MYPRVHAVITQQGNDISTLINGVADQYQFPPQVLVATCIMESNLDEHSERRGTWPDVSAGLWHQTVKYAAQYGLGNGQNTAGNIGYVFDVLKGDLPRAADIAGRQLGHWWRTYADGHEALGRYNAPSLGYQGNPNATNIRRGWETSARYVLAEVNDVSVPIEVLEELYNAITDAVPLVPDSGLGAFWIEHHKELGSVLGPEWAGDDGAIYQAYARGILRWTDHAEII